MTRRLMTLILFLFGLSACNLATSTPVAVVSSPTRPYINISSSTTVAQAATATRLINTIPTQTDVPSTNTPEPTVSPFACGVPVEGEHISHIVTTNLDYSDRSADVTQSIVYRNDEDVALAEIVIAVEPNAFDGAFFLETIAINGVEPFHTLTRNRLTVRLPVNLNPGCEVAIDMTYNIDFPRIGVTSNGFKGFFGYSDRQLNLGHWLPTPAPRIDNEWIVNNAQTIGEHNVLEQADWDVTFNITGTNTMRIAAPGTMEDLGDNQWRFTLASARDFPASLSPNWQVLEQTTPRGITIEVYHFGDTVRDTDSGRVDGAAHTLEISAQAADQFETLFGDYPYDRMLVVQGDFPDGMEFTGLVYVSTNWFYTFEGGIQNYLSMITIHEVAHQWWYASIGNDASIDPWLDEALSTYSEYIYIEEYYPTLRDWWWSFRVAWFNPEGDVDSDIYVFETGRAYINAIYLRGVQMLHNIREDVGTEAFFDILASYFDDGNGELVTAETFWAQFSEEQLQATIETRSLFLANPDVAISANQDNLSNE